VEREEKQGEVRVGGCKRKASAQLVYLEKYMEYGLSYYDMEQVDGMFNPVCSPE
jgi:hypothetical protein